MSKKKSDEPVFVECCECGKEVEAYMMINPNKQSKKKWARVINHSNGDGKRCKQSWRIQLMSYK